MKPKITANPLLSIKHDSRRLSLEIPRPMLAEAVIFGNMGTGEVCGLVVVENDTLTHIEFAAKGGPTFVKADEEYGMAEFKIISQLGQQSNGQIHTHPGMSAFFSVTDDKAQADHVSFALSKTDNFEYWVLVTNGLHWEARKFIAIDGVVSYHDVDCNCSGLALSSPRFTYDAKAKVDFIPGDIVSFDYKGAPVIAELVRTMDDGRWYALDDLDKGWYVPESIMTMAWDKTWKEDDYEPISTSWDYVQFGT